MTDWLVAVPRIFDIITLATVMLDILHIVDLGVTQYVVGHCLLYLLMQDVFEVSILAVCAFGVFGVPRCFGGNVFDV